MDQIHIISKTHLTGEECNVVRIWEGLAGFLIKESVLRDDKREWVCCVRREAGASRPLIKVF